MMLRFLPEHHTQAVPEWDQEGCRAYVLKWDIEGRHIETFGCLGMPAQSGVVPGVLLLHGGGGKVFPQWIAEWTDRGYAAFAIDLEGASDYYQQAGKEACKLRRTGDFDDVDKPVEEQWMYQAIAASIKALAFLKAVPGVDISRIGAVGISWGGLLTANLLAYGAQPGFAAAVYGCACGADDPAHFGNVFRETPKACALWNPMGRLGQVNAPVLWVNSPDDAFFSVQSTALCCGQNDLFSMCVLPGLSHGHEEARAVREVYAYADAVCGRGTPMPKVCLRLVGGQIYVHIHRLMVNQTGQWQMLWTRYPLRYCGEPPAAPEWAKSSWKPATELDFSVEPPEGGVLLFLNYRRSDGLLTTSNVIEI